MLKHAEILIIDAIYNVVKKNRTIDVEWFVKWGVKIDKVAFWVAKS